MIDDGWEVDSHTLTHPNLTSLGPTQLASEVGGSRHELHALFGIPVNFFCYPGGAYNATVIAATERAGYAGATTTNPGNATPRNSTRWLASMSSPPPSSARNDPVTSRGG